MEIVQMPGARRKTLGRKMFELLIHLMIAAVFMMELFQHWSHHRKKRKGRIEPRYTLDEARVILFQEALQHAGQVK